MVVLAADEVLLPGLVDTHVHVNEPGRTEWEGFASATRAAAAGGVTTIVDMPLNSIPPTTTVAALDEKRAVAAGQAWVDVGFWGGAVPANRADLAGLHEAGVFGFKCFLLDSGVEEFPHLVAADFAAAMAETARLGALMIVHAEDGDAIAACAHGRAYDGFLASRPEVAEERAIALVIDTARATGGRAHVVHLSAAGAIPALRAARAAGVDVSVETCPHYLHFESGSIPDGATALKCCPPIRDSANRDALWAGLRHGDIDLVVSDHSPCTPDLKRQDSGDFADAWAGSRRCSSACRPCGRPRGSGAYPWSTWSAGWRRRRPGGSGWPARVRSRSGRRRPVRLRARRVLGGRPEPAPPQERRLGLRRAYAHRHRPRDLVARCTDRPRRRATRAAAEKGRAMTYYVPQGGLPAQTELTTDRAVFTEAYAVLPRGTMRDIVTSRLPHWDDTRLWVIARPLSGFAETFSWYVTEVAAGGGSPRPDDDPDAESVLFVVGGTVELTIAGVAHRVGTGGYAFLPPGTPWTLRNDTAETATFHWIRKAYERVDGVEVPEAFVVQEQDVAIEPMPDTHGAWGTQRFVDPLDVRHDMHVNIVGFEPGERSRSPRPT